MGQLLILLIMTLLYVGFGLIPQAAKHSRQAKIDGDAHFFNASRITVLLFFCLAVWIMCNILYIARIWLK